MSDEPGTAAQVFFTLTPAVAVLLGTAATIYQVVSRGRPSQRLRAPRRPIHVGVVLALMALMFGAMSQAWVSAVLVLAIATIVLSAVVLLTGRNHRPGMR